MHPEPVRSVGIPVFNYAPRTARRPNAARFAALVGLVFAAIVLGLGITLGPRRFECNTRSGRARFEITPNGRLAHAIKLYRHEVGAWPRTLGDLIVRPQSEPAASQWTEPYLDTSSLSDPWGNLYAYAAPGVHNPAYDLWSVGVDGVSGSADDITNW